MESVPQYGLMMPYATRRFWCMKSTIREESIGHMRSTIREEIFSGKVGEQFNGK